MKRTGNNEIQRIALALAFIREHKELFEEWLKEKAEGKKKDECIK